MIRSIVNRKVLLASSLLSLTFLASSVASATAHVSAENVSAKQQLLAFPTAEGYGKYTTGGRGGKVYIVTNLNDSGPGSLREAIEARGARTIVFEVSGTIKLKSRLKISRGDLTIAGQTAPGEGITLSNYILDIATNNVIIRYIRSRYGDKTQKNEDAISMKYRKNIILDHVTASWGDDETMSIYHGENVTVQWSIISESLNNEEHGFGGIWGSPYSTFHHNLVAHNVSRNMRFSSGTGYTDYRNNVIYNWGYEGAYGGENDQPGNDKFNFTSVNMVGNYYKPGPATRKAKDRFVNPGTRDGDKDLGQFYVSGNYMYGNAEITKDNAKGVTKKKALMDKPWDSMKLESEQSAEEAFESVLEKAGASKVRDSVDKRVVEEVKTGTATYGENGIIESQDEVGGWPTLYSDNAPVDKDRDGMSDKWEKANGLDPSDASDANDTDKAGYTMLENYINSLI